MGGHGDGLHGRALLGQHVGRHGRAHVAGCDGVQAHAARTPVGAHAANPTRQGVLGGRVVYVTDGRVDVLHQLEDAILVGVVVQHAGHVHARRTLGDGVGRRYHAAAALLLQKVEHAARHLGGAEVVERDDQRDGHLAARHARVAVLGVVAFGEALVQLGDSPRAPFLRGQVGVDVAAVEVDVHHFMAAFAQDFGRLGADAAGGAGDDVDAHEPSFHADLTDAHSLVQRQS